MVVASLLLWLGTAVLGVVLAVRSGIVREVWQGRMPRRRVVLLTVHVVAAVTGLVLWALSLVVLTSPDLGTRRGVSAGEVLLLAGAVVCALIAVSHGLLMVSRWIPGHGRHASAARTRRRAGSYFPVHTATLHAMAAAATITTVLTMTLQALNRT